MNKPTLYTYSLIVVSTGELVSAGFITCENGMTQDEAINMIIRYALDNKLVEPGALVDLTIVESLDDPKESKALKDAPSQECSDADFLKACGIKGE